MAGYPTTSSKVDGTVSSKNKKHKSRSDLGTQALFTTGVIAALFSISAVVIIAFDLKAYAPHVMLGLIVAAPIVFFILRCLKVHSGMIDYVGFDANPSSSSSSMLFNDSPSAHAPAESFPAANGGSGLMETEIGWYRNP